MWKYIKPYIHYAIAAALCMLLEVCMDLLQPRLMSVIIDDGVLKQDNNIIVKYGIIMLSIAILGCLGGSANNFFVQIASQRIGNRLRCDSFRRCLSFSFSQIHQFGTGSLITRLSNDISQVQLFMMILVRGLVRISILLFGSIFFMFQLNSEFGFYVLIALPFMLLCMGFCIWKAPFQLLQSQLDVLNTIVQEDFSAIRVIKSCLRETSEHIRFNKANQALIKTQLRILTIFAFMDPAVNLIMSLVIASILCYGFNANLLPGLTMAAITYITQLLHSILMLIMLFQVISRGAASWKRVSQVLHTEPLIQSGSYHGSADESCKDKKGKIEFRHVSFAYQDDTPLILQDLNFVIHSGECVAIMGATASGKTSLVNLIPRFYDVTSGSVLVDDVNVREYDLMYLRNKISIQKTELFSRSIKENIAWKTVNSVTDEVIQFSKIAQAEDFILSTPNQYETILAERGANLSGGQKQRVTIARALCKKSEILILDDSTSALDFKTEAAFYKELQKITCTKLIITQRPVPFVDKVLLVDKGSVLVGTHQELLKTSSVYQEICLLQSARRDHA